MHMHMHMHMWRNQYTQRALRALPSTHVCMCCPENHPSHMTPVLQWVISRCYHLHDRYGEACCTHVVHAFDLSVCFVDVVMLCVVSCSVETIRPPPSYHLLVRRHVTSCAYVCVAGCFKRRLLGLISCGLRVVCEAHVRAAGHVHLLRPARSSM